MENVSILETELQMKPLLFSFLVVLLMVSCQDDENSPSSPLRGKWNWKSSCGGIVGCTYESAEHTQELIFGNSTLVLRENDHVVWGYTYTVKSTSSDGDSTTIEIELEDGSVWYCTISGNTLTVAFLSMFTSVYSRF
jgi:hypothetical protein